MLFVISPAKTLDFTVKSNIKPSSPLFNSKTKELIDTLQQISSCDIAALMSISNNLAELNYQRYQNFYTNEAKPALLCFKGDVYQHIDAANYSNEDFLYAQEHMRILSGLYGLLRPMDEIKPYRLEMGTKLKTRNCKDLYEFWQETVTKELSNEEFIINLASNEYSHVINSKKLNGKIINIVFKEENLKIVGLFAKRARGMMADYIIKNRINTPQALKNFNQANYIFNPEASDNDNYIFIRNI